MTIDYSKKNLQRASFKNESLVNTSFMGCDLRGVDFSGTDLTNANLTHVKTGITPLNTALIFFVAILVSMFSGYVAMVAGTTIHGMLKSGDDNVRAAGISTLAVIVLFMSYYYWKGGRSVIMHLLLPVLATAVVIGAIAYFSGLGSGRGMFFLVLSLLLVMVMVFIGTIARSLAGVLSSTILFMLVAIGGSMFGTSVGGGIGTVVMAIGCALISKRALSGAKGFEVLAKVAAFTTNKFGTSFRNAKLTNTNFSHSKIMNADFTNADVTTVNWGESKKENCTPVYSKREFQNAASIQNNNFKKKDYESYPFHNAAANGSRGNEPKEKESRSQG